MRAHRLAASPTLNLVSHACVLRSRVAGAAGPHVYLRRAPGPVAAARGARDCALPQREADRRGDGARRQGSGGGRGAVSRSRARRGAAAQRASAGAGGVDRAILPGAAGRGAARHVAAGRGGAAHGLLPADRSGARRAGGGDGRRCGEFADSCRRRQSESGAGSSPKKTRTWSAGYWSGWPRASR